MTRVTRNGWKTCSRGHKYRGSKGCPICWKLHHAKNAGGKKDAPARKR